MAASVPKLSELHTRKSVSGQPTGYRLGLPCIRTALSLAFIGRRETRLIMRNQTLIPSFQRPPSSVVIRRAASYEQDLASLIFESLGAFNLAVKGKSVLLKPNLVGPDPLGVMNTHPAVIAATRESFLRLGAARVLVGDGPAMDRDTEAIIESVRLREFTWAAGPQFRGPEHRRCGSSVELEDACVQA